MKDKVYCRREIMDKFNISRRVIEGYEGFGLIKPISQNDRGTYFYDGKAIKRIGFIRLCQKMGFEIKDIVEFIDKPNSVIKEKLNQQKEVIENELKDLKKLLYITTELTKSNNPKESEEIFKIFKEV